MTAYVYPNPKEKVISGAGALGMHLLFIALLVFGVNWQKKVEPQANIVDLWTDLTPQLPTKVEPVPQPPPPQPEAPPKIEPPPPLKSVSKPEVAKPEIALKEKAEKERRLLEDKKNDAKKRDAEKQQLAAREAAEAQRLAREQEEAQRKVVEQAAAARLALIDKYKKAINDKIKRSIVLPPNLQGNPETEFNVVLLPDGNVLGGSTLRRSSGNPAYDSAVERAIARAQPLPLPPDPALFKDFRELSLKFRPQE